MNLLKKEQAEASGSGICSFAPIARALSHLPDEEKEQLRRKFDIAYFIALEKFSSGSTHVFVSWKLVMESRSVPRIPAKLLGKLSLTT